MATISWSAGKHHDDARLAHLPPEVCPCGEDGEFHTFLWHGPGFAHPVAWQSLGLETVVSQPPVRPTTRVFERLST